MLMDMVSYFVDHLTIICAIFLFPWCLSNRHEQSLNFTMSDDSFSRAKEKTTGQVMISCKPQGNTLHYTISKINSKKTHIRNQLPNIHFTHPLFHIFSFCLIALSNTIRHLKDSPGCCVSTRRRARCDSEVWPRKIPGKPVFRGGFVQSGGSIPAILCLAQASAWGWGWASVLGPQLCS